MHMADALLSPAVGGILWAGAAATIGHCSHRLRRAADDGRVPLMGVLGAFVFTAQMINFTIPGTGSSGHLGGGLLLAILLGPHAALLAIASVLTIQALFFADGGLLALGANIVNLGFFPCFVAYPLFYRPVAGAHPTRRRLMGASVAAAMVGLQLGALGVVLETVASGVSAVPFKNFLILMLPIHLAIGLVEGVVTGLVVNFVRQADPGLFLVDAGNIPRGPARRRVLVGMLVGTVLAGGVLSWFASPRPDGLEWSLARVSGREGVPSAENRVQSVLAAVQARVAFLADYQFRRAADEVGAASESSPAWPAANPSTSLAGLLGGLLTLAVVGFLGFVLRNSRRNRRM